MVLLELFLRFSGTSIPSFVQDDARFGRVLRPNAPLLFVNEGFHLGDVNRWGYLGPGYPPKKPPGTFRIALLGDSFVEGFQLFDRHHVRSLLERDLSRDGARVEVLNFGLSGFNFPLMFDYGREFVSQYEPDVVAFFVGSEDFAQPSTDLGPRFRVEGDSLIVDLEFAHTPPFRRKTRFGSIRNFGFYTLLKKAYTLARQGRTAAIVLDKLHPDHGQPPPEIDWDEESAAIDPGRDRVNRWMMAELGRRNASGSVRIVFIVKGHVADSHAALIEENGMALWDPKPALDALRAQGIDPQWWPATSKRGHWNARGHEAIAEYLRPKLRDWVEP
jgi:lysophospholipase L1-like esterase